MLARDQGEAEQMVETTGMGAVAATGAVAGGLLGGLAGFLVGISALAIPGIGPIVGAGILVSTLVGAGGGAAAGGLIGALTEHGVPEEAARGYEAHVEGGRILLTVHADSDQAAQEAHRLLAGGTDVRAYGTGGARMAGLGRTGTGVGTTATGTLAGGGRDVSSTGELRDEHRGTPGR